MLNLLQLRNSFLFLSAFLFFILLISFSEGVELGVSPASIDFYGESGNFVCKNLSIFFSEDNIPIEVNDTWSKNRNSRDVNNYKLSADELGIVSKYKNSFLINKEKNFEICIKSQYAGNFNGVLIFDVVGKSLSVGSWMNANFVGNNAKVSKITGFSEKDSSEPESFNLFEAIMPLTIFNMLLLAVLLFLFFRKKMTK